MPASIAHNRVRLIDGESPLTRLPSLSDHLGIELFVKRDDLIGAPFGGNKTRQLEYHLGAARQAGADTILITGAVQSNFVRTAAYAAASLGMKTVVQLEERVPGMDEMYRNSGNVLLLRIVGAEILHYPDGEDEVGADANLRQHADALRKSGRSPYLVPLAVNNPPLGALGYINAAEEILRSGQEFDAIVVASGSGATHAGLLTGIRSGGSRATVIGSCVRRPAARQTERIAKVLDLLGELTDQVRSVAPDDIRVWDGALFPGYGRPGEAAMEAMTLMAQKEGILLDPVYTAKAFAAIPDLVASGEIARGSRVLFVHTGGLAAVFGYQSVLEAEFRSPG